MICLYITYMNCVYSDAWRRVEIRCGGKEEKSVWKSLGMLIYRATLLLSQSACVLAHVQDQKSLGSATLLLSPSSHGAILEVSMRGYSTPVLKFTRGMCHWHTCTLGQERSGSIY